VVQQKKTPDVVDVDWMPLHPVESDSSKDARFIGSGDDLVHSSEGASAVDVVSTAGTDPAVVSTQQPGESGCSHHEVSGEVEQPAAGFVGSGDDLVHSSEGAS